MIDKDRSHHPLTKLKSGSSIASIFTVEYMSACNASSIIVVKRFVDIVSRFVQSTKFIAYLICF